MKSYKHIFFCFLMMSTFFSSEGMEIMRCIDNSLSKGMKIMQRIDDSIPCVTKVFASTVVILYMLNDCAEDSDSDDMYFPSQKKVESLFGRKEENECKSVEQVTKKDEEKDIVSEETDDTALFAELFPFGLLYELSNVP